MPEQFENGREMTGKTHCKILIPKKCTYTLRIDQSFQKRRKMFCFHNFRVFTRCRCWFKNSVFKIYRFQNLPVKMCRFRVNGRPIRHILHRFQNVLPWVPDSPKKENFLSTQGKNVPASCEILLLLLFFPSPRPTSFSIFVPRHFLQ